MAVRIAAVIAFDAKRGIARNPPLANRKIEHNAQDLEQIVGSLRGVCLGTNDTADVAGL
jgi:hypothetical protein